MTTLQIHFFNSTGEAYDATQCDENIKNGDILVVRSECVVGLADTWPVAVTHHHGAFHVLTDGNFGTYRHQFGSNAGELVFTDQQVELAKAVAAGLGFNFRPGDKVIYRPVDHEDGPAERVTVVANIEGWYQVKFRDGSDAIVRPSRLRPAT